MRTRSASRIRPSAVDRGAAVVLVACGEPWTALFQVASASSPYTGVWRHQQVCHSLMSRGEGEALAGHPAYVSGSLTCGVHEGAKDIYQSLLSFSHGRFKRRSACRHASAYRVRKGFFHSRAAICVVPPESSYLTCAFVPPYPGVVRMHNLHHLLSHCQLVTIHLTFPMDVYTLGHPTVVVPTTTLHKSPTPCKMSEIASKLQCALLCGKHVSLVKQMHV